MRIKIIRGTNPVIQLRISDGELLADSDSYVTVRKKLTDREKAVDSTTGEVQIALNADGSENTDTDGNTFSIAGNTATLAFSRNSTKKMEYGVYYIQFNIKDKDGKLFANKPDIIDVQVNLTDFTE